MCLARGEKMIGGNAWPCRGSRVDLDVIDPEVFLFLVYNLDENELYNNVMRASHFDHGAVCR